MVGGGKPLLGGINNLSGRYRPTAVGFVGKEDSTS